METTHNETVVDKAVGFVKDMLGLQSDTPPTVEEKPEYSDAPAVTSDDAMRFDPNAFETKVGELNADTYVRPAAETDAERLRREVGEPPRDKSGVELSTDSAPLIGGAMAAAIITPIIAGQ
jgi:hypothetical protein